MTEYMCVMCRALIAQTDLREIKTGENASFYLCSECRPKWETQRLNSNINNNL